MSKNYFADTRPTKEYLINGITKDVSIEECIFDLIDNSIDAYSQNNNNLISNYKNYTIEITIKDNFFSIKDCGKGIERALLTSDTLRFGSQTEHNRTSIGFYGIGLNRAIFKLGKNIEIITETKKERSLIKLNVLEFIQDNNNWQLPVLEINPIKKIGTLIEIKNISDDINDNFKNDEWVRLFTNQISQRYCEFLNRNLIIKINSKEVPIFDISIRESSGFKRLNKELLINGVKVIIELGQNNNHFFTYEKNYDKEKNATIKDCGWFVFCNNRAVKLFDWTTDTGWHTRVHSEHNGFIGKISFIGDAGKLPWNTSKTNVDLNNEIYKTSLITMKSFSESWRTHAFKIVKKGFRPNTYEHPQIEDLFKNFESVQNDDEKKLSLEQSQFIKSNSDQLVKIESDKPSPQQVQLIEDEKSIIDIKVESESLDEIDDILPTHEQLMYEIPEHALNYNKLFEGYPQGKHPFNIPSTATKLNSIINEMSKLKLDSKNGNPYAILFLLRSFIELSCKHYIKVKNSKIKIDECNSLAQQVEKCIDHMISNNLFNSNQDEDSRNIDSLKALCFVDKNKKSIRNIQYLQNTLHNPRLIWDKENINAFWISILPFLIKCYE